LTDTQSNWVLSGQAPTSLGSTYGVSNCAARTGTLLKGANLTNARLAHTDPADGWLTGVALTSAVLTEANFRGARLNWANLGGANLACAQFTDGSLTKVIALDPV